MRRPLLALGELSKRSLGTFRWVRKGDRRVVEGRVRAAARRDRQAVRADVLPRRRTTTSRARSSTSSRSAAPRRRRTSCRSPRRACGGERVRDRLLRRRHVRAVPRGRAARGVFGWILLIGGVAVGVVVVLGVIGCVVTKRKQPRRMPPGDARACRCAGHRRRASRRSPMPPVGAEQPPQAPASSPNGRADPRAARHDRPAHRRAHPAPQRLPDRQAARLRPPDRGRLHVEPARADRRWTRRQLHGSTTAARRTARSSTACAITETRSQHGVDRSEIGSTELRFLAQ